MSVLITGITGQDGSYLAEQVLQMGEKITGLLCPGEKLPDYFDSVRQHPNCQLVACDLADPAAFRLQLRSVQPTKVFHLGAISSPAACAEHPDSSRNVNVKSVEVLDEWLRRESPGSRVLTVSSAAVFGNPAETPQTEQTPVRPINDYGRQKLAVMEIARDSREAGFFMACAIPYNHESPRRREEFVIAHIVNAAAAIKLGRQRRLELGDLSPRRDWGYAPEYVTGLLWMLDVEKPTELILATGVAHSVKDATELAFKHLGLDYRDFVDSDPTRRSIKEPFDSVGNASLAWQELGWEAATRLPQLIPMLVDCAISRIKLGQN